MTLRRTRGREQDRGHRALLAVADGMGGHAAGEVASAATITTIAPLDAEEPGPDLARTLAEAPAAGAGAGEQAAAADRMRAKFPTAAVAAFVFRGGWDQLGPEDYYAVMEETPEETERRRAAWPCTRIAALLSPELRRIG